MIRHSINLLSRLIFLFVLLLSLLIACSKPMPDEQQISLAMDKMQQAADEKQLASLMQHFHDSFQGRHNMPKRDLQARIYFHFRTNPRVRIFVSNRDIQIEDNMASVSCHLLVTGGQKRMPDRGRLYRVISTWQKHGDTWQVMTAKWEDVVKELVN